MNDSPADPVTLSLFALLPLALLARLRPRLARTAPGHRLFRSLGQLEVGLMGTMVFVLVGLGITQIILRNFFHRGLLWIDPLMRHLVLWIGCLGAALASVGVRHINIDVFTRLLKGRSKWVRDRVVFAATAFASSLLGTASLGLVLEEKSFGEISSLGLPTWTLQVVLPYAFFLIAYRSLLAFWTGAAVGRAQTPSSPNRERGDQRTNGRTRGDSKPFSEG